MTKNNKKIYGYKSVDKGTLDLLRDLSSAGDKLNLPKDLLLDAIKIYEGGIKDKWITGDFSPKNLMAAAIDIAIMKRRKISKARELSNVFGILLLDLLKTRNKVEIALDIELPPTLTSDYLFTLQKAYSKLNLSGETRDKAISLVQEAYENGIESENKLDAAANWMDVAAAAVYISSKNDHKNITLKQVAEATGISEDIIMKRVIELYSKLNLYNKKDFIGFDLSKEGLGHAFEKIKNAGDELGLSEEIQKEAANIYLKAVCNEPIRAAMIESVTNKHKLTENLAAGALYTAARRNIALVFLEKISKLFDLKEKDVAMAHHILRKGLNIDLPQITASAYLHWLTDHPNFSDKTVSDANKLLKMIEKNSLITKENLIITTRQTLNLSALINNDNTRVFMDILSLRRSGFPFYNDDKNVYKLIKSAERRLPDFDNSFFADMLTNYKGIRDKTLENILSDARRLKETGEYNLSQFDQSNYLEGSKYYNLSGIKTQEKIFLDANKLLKIVKDAGFLNGENSQLLVGYILFIAVLINQHPKASLGNKNGIS